MSGQPKSFIVPTGIRGVLKGPISSVLVFRPRYIGDVLLTIPALRQLRVSLPGVRITFLGSPSVRELLEHCPYIDETLILERKGRHQGLVGRWRLIRELRQRKFDLALVFMRSFSSALFSYLAGARYRAGFSTELRGPLLTHAVPYSHSDHEACCFLSVLESLGIECQPPRLEVWIPDGAQTFARGWFREKSITPGRSVLFVNPGGPGNTRALDPARLARLSDRLCEGFGLRVVVIWGPGEESRAAEVIRAMRNPAELAPPTSLLELAAMFSCGGTLLTHDSGPLHLAAAVGIDTVALFAPTSASKWNPPGDRNVYVEATSPCRSCDHRTCRHSSPCILQVNDDEIVAAFASLQGSRQFRRAA